MAQGFDFVHSLLYLRIVGAREGRDDAETNYRLTQSRLRQHPDLVGLYNIGGGAEGVGRAIKESRRDPGAIVFVAHGLTPDTRGLLIDGHPGRCNQPECSNSFAQRCTHLH